jgi:tRNA pseudouridine55 synthase
MARKSGRDITGWLIVDKPAGIGSTQIVGKVRWALDAKKAGHAGTLDPAATGLLAVALGEATKTIPYIAEALKSYRFTVCFGQSTDTDDAEGEVTGDSALRPSDVDIRAALPGFTGDIMQVPPKVSAVKVAGGRAYDLARDKAEFDLAARPLRVERLSLIAHPDADHAELEMVCGKGGYVRAIARDLGLALGTLGHVQRLRRLWSGPFDLMHAVTLAEIEAEARTPALEARLLPLETALAGLPEVRCTAAGAARLRNGNPGQVLTAAAGYGDEAWASFEGRAVAVGIYRAGELAPCRVFNR